MKLVFIKMVFQQKDRSPKTLQGSGNSEKEEETEVCAWEKGGWSFWDSNVDRKNNVFFSESVN